MGPEENIDLNYDPNLFLFFLNMQAMKINKQLNLP